MDPINYQNPTTMRVQSINPAMCMDMSQPEWRDSVTISVREKWGDLSLRILLLLGGQQWYLGHWCRVSAWGILDIQLWENCIGRFAPISTGKCGHCLGPGRPGKSWSISGTPTTPRQCYSGCLKWGRSGWILGLGLDERPSVWGGHLERRNI